MRFDTPVTGAVFDSRRGEWCLTTQRGETLRARVPALQWLHRQLIYWFNESMVPGFVFEPRLLKPLELLARSHLRRQVPDVRLRRALTPAYRIGCKRVLLSNNYYPALSRPNVNLHTEGVGEISQDGIATRSGVKITVDAILLGTGFYAAEDVLPFPVTGRDGQDLRDVWRRGAQAYKGTTVAGFPNQFFLVGPNTGLGHSSMIHVIESQIAYVLQGVRALSGKGIAFLNVWPDVQAAYNRKLARRMKRTVWSTGGCQSWYQTAGGRNTTLWPGFTFEFRWQTRRLRLAEYQIERRPGAI